MVPEVEPVVAVTVTVLPEIETLLEQLKPLEPQVMGLGIVVVPSLRLKLL